MPFSSLRIGTRASPLAMWQANHVAERLRPLVGGRDVELVEIQTSGDQIRDLPLSQIGGQGVFTKEIQRALLAESVDVAVHSLKDLPTVPTAGLILAAVPRRGPTGDVLIAHRHRNFDSLPRNALVATSSLRRRAQILNRRPDLRTIDVRGNVETRLRKLREQDLDATILAQAGLERLGLAHAITEILDPSWMLPAVGQGALGLECRDNDTETYALLRQLDDRATHQAVLAERAMLRTLLGGCQVPIGASATVDGTTLTLRGTVLSLDGSRRIAGTVTGLAQDAEALGRQLAEELLSKGAQDLLSV